MLNLHLLGEVADARSHSAGCALDGQQQLMLLWFQAGRARHLLAEMQKAADLVAEFSQGAVIRQVKMVMAAQCGH